MGAVGYAWGPWEGQEAWRGLGLKGEVQHFLGGLDGRYLQGVSLACAHV